MGPPHPIGGLPGWGSASRSSWIRSEGLRWRANGEVIEFAEADGRWRAETKLLTAGPYEVEVVGNGLNRGNDRFGGAHGASGSAAQIEFVQPTMSFNVVPGERLPFRLRAEDDHGIKEITVVVRSAFGGSPPATVKTWAFAGPPGRTANLRRRWSLAIDASLFAPGGKYLVEAASPISVPTINRPFSRPVLIEVKSLDKLSMPTSANLGDVYMLSIKPSRLKKSPRRHAHADQPYRRCLAES